MDAIKKEGFSIELQYGDGLILPPHDHEEDPEFLQVVRGSVDVTVGLNTYRITAGGILHIAPGLVHYAYSVGGAATMRTLTYRLSAVLSMDKLDANVLSRYLLHFRNRMALFSVGHTLHRALSGYFDTAVSEWQGREIFYGTLVTAQISHMVATVLRFYGYGQDSESQEYRNFLRIRPVLEYIDTHYAEKMRLEELASGLSLSPDHFGKLFRDALDTTPVEYVNAVRINHAQHHLINGKEPLAVIAKRCGFASATYFHKVFHDLTGTSPVAFRKMGDSLPAGL